jgi:hypothetical protein
LRLQRGYGPKRMSYHLKLNMKWFVSDRTIWRLYKEALTQHSCHQPQTDLLWL